MKNRRAYVEFIEDSYFGSVASGLYEKILDCFTDDARVIIRHGDNPERRFAVNPGDEELALASFYEHLCQNYDCWFGDFHHYVDLEQRCAASRFTVRLKPKPGGLYANESPQELRNCNFFDFHDHRIGDMIIYYSNPNESPDDATTKERPTGYPKS